MAINLKKGQRVDIGLQNLGIGLGWDPSAATGIKHDLDLSAFMLVRNLQVPAENFFVYYNNMISPDGAIESSGDDRTGGNSDGDDETLMVDLSRLDPRINQIIFTVTIHDETDDGKLNFGQIQNSFIRIYDATDDTELCKYELDEDFSVETAIEFGRLYKRNDTWRFEAIGDGHQGGLETFVKKYASAFA